MSDPVFPTLSRGQDSSLYALKFEDPAIKSPMEGGYVVSRARHTRVPRKMFHTGFTLITEVDRLALVAFYETVRGSSVIFDWTDPVTLVVYKVRFAEQMAFKYAGVGYNKLWDVSFGLEQA